MHYGTPTLKKLFHDSMPLKERRHQTFTAVEWAERMRQNKPWSSCQRLRSQTIHCLVRHQHNEPNPGDRSSPDIQTRI